jgi:hypothetical protein
MEPTMPTYTADFRTDTDYATHTFKARSPQDALKKPAPLTTSAPKT